MFAASVGHAGVELVRAVITNFIGQDRLSRKAAESTLACAILEYTRVHLAEHDLAAPRIASALHVSVRQLYATLARADVTLGDRINERRLEECRRQLARPDAGSKTIAAVARHWGFVDATHFGRAFKHTYDMTPRQWRDHQQLLTTHATYH